MKNTSLNEKNLINLGFEKTHVSFEESGGDPFDFLTYDIKDSNGSERCIFISDEIIGENKNVSYVEFFTMPEIGIIKDYDILKDFINLISKINNPNE